MSNKESQQIFDSYDYTENKTGPGAGFYSNLDKYKSVMDFRQKKMKRRKKILNKIKNHKVAFDNPYQDIADPTIYDSDEPSIHPIGGVADRQQQLLDSDGNPITNMLTQVRDTAEDINNESGVKSELGDNHDQEPNYLITPHWQTEDVNYYENKFRGVMDPSDPEKDMRLIK